MRAVEPWVMEPLERFLGESSARLTLLMTSSGQVVAQHGFTRSVDVMTAAALGAAIVASTQEIARLVGEAKFLSMVHQGLSQHVFLSGFETPRGRLVVQSKEEAPVWAPPDWHYVEQSRKRGLGLARLVIGRPLNASDGSVITVEGNEVVRVLPDGRRNVLQATDGREIVVDGKILVPPLGTTQRRYEGVLGTYRLNMGDGYAIHGTNQPETVGRAVSHGCVRLRNEDIAKLYAMVPVGTPVYIY